LPLLQGDYVFDTDRQTYQNDKAVTGHQIWQTSSEVLCLLKSTFSVIGNQVLVIAKKGLT